MSANDSFVEALREQIEKKHREAIQALEVLKGYLLETGSVVTPAQLTNGSSGKPGKAIIPLTGTNVDRVMKAIEKEYKNVDQIEADTGLSAKAVRGVLSGPSNVAKLSKKRINKKLAYKVKQLTPDAPSSGAAGTEEETAASLVRDLMAKHHSGLTAGQVMESIATDLERIGGKKPAVGAALYNMKKRGKLAYNETTGVYTPIRKD